MVYTPQFNAVVSTIKQRARVSFNCIWVDTDED